MDALRELERRGWEALSAGGREARAFYGDVLADEVVMLFPGGFRLSDRSAVLDAMSGEPWGWFRLQDELVATVTPDVAVLTYRARAQRDGQPEYQALCSSTYARRGDDWKLVAHQHTPF